LKEEDLMATAAPTTGPAPALLYGIDWETYIRLLRVFEKSRRLRLTYDRGTLQIMSPLWEHEGPVDLLGCFVVVLTEELQLARRAGGSVTLRRRGKQRGLEPDRCYWIASAARMQGKTHLDLRTDPPPDLAIEVDVTNSSVDRMSIYAALGVPEVWRLSSTGLTFNLLKGRLYQVQPNSLAFPQLVAADLMGFLNQFGQVDEGPLVIQFRAWVRQQLMGRQVP
jgi:Uma2 family endonuclease